MEKGHVSSKGHIKNPSKNWSAKGAKVRSAHHPGSENWATSGVSCPWEVFGHEVGCCSNMAEYHGVRGREGVTRKALEAEKLWILGSCEVEKSSPPVPIQIWSSSHGELVWILSLESSHKIPVFQITSQVFKYNECNSNYAYDLHITI